MTDDTNAPERLWLYHLDNGVIRRGSLYVEKPRDIETEEYHHDRVLKAAQDRIAALEAENDRLRGVIDEAKYAALDIVENPNPLWNYGTRPSAIDKAERSGKTIVALEILSAIDAALKATECQSDE